MKRDNLNDVRFLEVADALRANEPFLARVLLTKIPHVFSDAADDAMADEAANLIREGQIATAIERIEMHINPKFSSEAECLQHVGSDRHFHPIKQGNLL
jgi:hypothetical protein